MRRTRSQKISAASPGIESISRIAQRLRRLAHAPAVLTRWFSGIPYAGARRWRPRHASSQLKKFAY